MKNFKRFVLIVLCLALVPTLTSANLKVGDKPTLQFKGYGGTGEVDLEKLRGKIVLVDFWATWCGPCMAEADHMVKIHKEYGPKGLQMVGISLDSNGNKMLQVAKQAGFDWPQHFDGKGWQNEFAKAWGVGSIPATYLLSPDGVVLWTGHPARIDAAIEDAFKKHPPRLADAELVAKATQQLEQVEQALEKQDYRNALKLLGRIPADARVDADFAARANEVATKLEQAAQQMLDESTAMLEQKQYVEAVSKLKAIASAMSGTSIGKAAQQKLVQLSQNSEARGAIAQAEKNQKADEALALAQQLQQAGKDDNAYTAFKSIMRSFAGTPAAEAAQQAVQQYEANPQFVRKANESAAKSKAPGMISLAENYKKQGLKEQAKRKYQDVIDQFPETSFAETAQRELATMD